MLAVIQKNLRKMRQIINKNKFNINKWLVRAADVI